MIKSIEIDNNKLILIEIDSRTGEISSGVVVVDYKNFPRLTTYISQFSPQVDETTNHFLMGN